MRFVKVMCPCKREHYKRVEENTTIRVDECEHILTWVDLDSDTHIRTLCRECKVILDIQVDDNTIHIKSMPYGDRVEAIEGTVVYDGGN